MKNLSLVLNAVLLVAVGVLFYLHFTSRPAGSGDAAADGKGGNDSVPQLKMDLPKDLSSKKILYINGDTVSKYYEPLAARNKELEQKQKYYEKDVLEKQSKFEENYYQAQQLAQSGQLSETARPQVEAELRKLQEAAEMAQRNYDSFKNTALAEQMKLMEEVKAHFADFSKEHGIDFILIDGDGLIAYGNPDLDISKQIAASLNENYKKQQADKKAAPAKK